MTADGWTQVPNWALDAIHENPDATPTTVAVYVAVRRYCDYGKDDGAHPSLETIGREAGVSRRKTVQRHLNVLREAEVLSWDTGASEWSTNAYSAPLDPPDAGAEREGPIRATA